jgi:hypothetical protein
MIIPSLDDLDDEYTIATVDCKGWPMKPTIEESFYVGKTHLTD